MRSIWEGFALATLTAVPVDVSGMPTRDVEVCPAVTQHPHDDNWLGSPVVRPIWPQSGSWLDRGTVEFVWKPAIAATVEMSRSKLFVTVDQRIRGTGSTQTCGAVDGGLWFWRLRLPDVEQTSPVWSFHLTPQPRPGTGGSGSSVGSDFDGDGLDDTICARDLFFGSPHIDQRGRDASRTTFWSTHHEGCPVYDWGATPPNPQCGTITGSWPAGDFNGDGHADVVSIDFDKNLLLYLGRDAFSIPRNLTPSYRLRTGALAAYRDFPVPIDPAEISAQVLAGRGPGTPNAIIRGDMNGDGYSDISDGWYVIFGAAAAERARVVSVDWREPVAFASGCDLNGDYLVDVAALSREGKLSVYLGSEVGLEVNAVLTVPWTEAAALQSTDAATTNPVQLVDVDNDGHCDVVSMFTSLERPELAELRILLGSTIVSRAPKVQRHYWRRASVKGKLSWLLVPRAYADDSPVLVIYDTAPYSVTFRLGVLDNRRGLRADTQRPKLLGELDDIAHHYELYIRGDVDGDGRLDIAENEIMHTFYGGVLRTRLGSHAGTFDQVVERLTWGGPEQGFFVQ